MFVCSHLLLAREGRGKRAEGACAGVRCCRDYLSGVAGGDVVGGEWQECFLVYEVSERGRERASRNVARRTKAEQGPSSIKLQENHPDLLSPTRVEHERNQRYRTTCHSSSSYRATTAPPASRSLRTRFEQRPRSFLAVVIAAASSPTFRAGCPTAAPRTSLEKKFSCKSNSARTLFMLQESLRPRGALDSARAESSPPRRKRCSWTRAAAQCPYRILQLSLYNQTSV